MQMSWDITPWTIRHASNVLSWTKYDTAGQTPYQKARGRPFNKQLAQFWEKVFYLKPKSTGTKNHFPKPEQRWDFGTWLEKYGYTEGCAGCTQVRCQIPYSRGHNDNCRARFQRIFEGNNDIRLQRENNEYLPRLQKT